MGLKKAELYRGFNLFTEEVRAGGWRVALVEVPASDGGWRIWQSGDQAIWQFGSRAHVDRIHQNRRSRSS